MNIILYLSLIMLFGGSFLAMEIIVQYVPPSIGAFFRVLVGLIFLILVMTVSRFGRKVSSPSYMSNIKTFLLYNFAIGLFLQEIPFTLLFTAEMSITSGEAGFLMVLIPYWTALLVSGCRIESRLPNSRIFLSTALCGMGVVLSYGLQIDMSSPSKLTALLYVVISTVSYAVGSVISKLSVRSGLNTSFNQSLVSVIVQHCFSLLILLGAVALKGEL